MKFDPVNLDMIFETSWEVCNKIGGIYTVLSTKAQNLQNLYKDKVVFIGPDVWSEENSSPYFTEVPSLLKPWREKAVLPQGVAVRIGRWNIPGKPIVILVDFKGMFALKDYYYGEMWQRYGVDSLHAYGDYDEACAFSLAAGAVIESICNYKRLRHKNVLAHFDEWTTGMGLLYIKWKVPYVGTLFTTHATSIGRSICGNGKPLYDYLPAYNGDQMARELNMESKHSLEKAAAHQADCFTAVSELTAKECEQLLEIRPQVVTPNGFEPDFVPDAKNYKKLRKEGRERLLRIASVLKGREFGDDTCLVATSGRNEYRNKGLDLFIDSMVRLEDENPSHDVLALILVPAWVKEPAGDLLIDLNDNGDIRPEMDYMTHRLNNEDSDSICRRLGQLEGEGKLKGGVEAVYVPCYLDGHDGIVDISYYDILPALDLTVFPSYYEPWGYTPLESVAFGIPTVTTDKSGFGQWVLSDVSDSMLTSGVRVIPRTDSNYGEAAAAIASTIKDFTEATPSVREKEMKAAAATAAKADWKYFIQYYYDAFNVAMKRRDYRLGEKKK